MKPYTWRAAILRSDLPSTTRHVLLTLSCYVNDVGQSAYPSIETLANNTGLTDRAVIKHLQIAKEHGFLAIGKHGFAGRRWAHNEYFPKIPNVEYEIPPVDNSVSRGEPYSPHKLEGVNDVQLRGEPRSCDGVNDVHTNYPKELSNNNSSLPSPSSPAVDKVPRAIAKRLPEEWVLPKKWGEWALKEFPLWTADHVRFTADMFRDHWIAASGQNARKLDWFATWRNWCRKSPSPAQAKSGGSGALPWYSSDALILEKGASLGLSPLAGETMNAFKGRIQARIDAVAHPPSLPPAEKPSIVIRSDGPKKLADDIGSDELRKAALEQAKRITGVRKKPSDGVNDGL